MSATALRWQSAAIVRQSARRRRAEQCSSSRHPMWWASTWSRGAYDADESVQLQRAPGRAVVECTTLELRATPGHFEPASESHGQRTLPVSAPISSSCPRVIRRRRALVGQGSYRRSDGERGQSPRRSLAPPPGADGPHRSPTAPRSIGRSFVPWSTRKIRNRRRSITFYPTRVASAARRRLTQTDRQLRVPICCRRSVRSTPPSKRSAAARYYTSALAAFPRTRAS